ncbi:hypothetical protein [Paenibacillus sp. GCM10012306]|uniref:hypothetical protein n=1 Tax=Paenibacillus sp. GCM10012306 TaxID=3317342 RepID=UPI00361092F7
MILLAVRVYSLGLPVCILLLSSAAMAIAGIINYREAVHVVHLLDLESLTSEQINDIFTLTDQLRLEQPGLPLHGKTFALFFPETSLRTRITFEKGIHRLGGQSLLFPPETLDRPEALSDVIQYLGTRLNSSHQCYDGG